MEPRAVWMGPRELVTEVWCPWRRTSPRTGDRGQNEADWRMLTLAETLPSLQDLVPHKPHAEPRCHTAEGFKPWRDRHCLCQWMGALKRNYRKKAIFLVHAFPGLRIAYLLPPPPASPHTHSDSNDFFKNWISYINSMKSRFRSKENDQQWKRTLHNDKRAILQLTILNIYTIGLHSTGASWGQLSILGLKEECEDLAGCGGINQRNQIKQLEALK